MVFLYERERQVDAGAHAGRGVGVPVAGVDRIRLDAGAEVPRSQLVCDLPDECTGTDQPDPAGSVCQRSRRIDQVAPDRGVGVDAHPPATRMVSHPFPFPAASPTESRMPSEESTSSPVVRRARSRTTL